LSDSALGALNLSYEKTKLNIDGHTCHHVHNCVKAFCGHFDKIVEGLCDDLHGDLKWSEDLRNLLKELCSIVGCTYHMPKERVASPLVICT
jgi:hypothetical protein